MDGDLDDHDLPRRKSVRELARWSLSEVIKRQGNEGLRFVFLFDVLIRSPAVLETLGHFEPAAPAAQRDHARPTSRHVPPAHEPRQANGCSPADHPASVTAAAATSLSDTKPAVNRLLEKELADEPPALIAEDPVDRRAALPAHPAAASPVAAALPASAPRRAVKPADLAEQQLQKQQQQKAANEPESRTAAAKRAMRSGYTASPSNSYISTPKLLLQLLFAVLLVAAGLVAWAHVAELNSKPLDPAHPAAVLHAHVKYIAENPHEAADHARAYLEKEAAVLKSEASIVVSRIGSVSAECSKEAWRQTVFFVENFNDIASATWMHNTAALDSYLSDTLGMPPAEYARATLDDAATKAHSSWRKVSDASVKIWQSDDLAVVRSHVEPVAESVMQHAHKIQKDAEAIAGPALAKAHKRLIDMGIPPHYIPIVGGALMAFMFVITVRAMFAHPHPHAQAAAATAAAAAASAGGSAAAGAAAAH
ncbi:hypothetical protein HK105_208433 [Polyrhizophydium stewartii]|uniref:Uncharacterized protein n=1 Tax=Polyrhizophydium stewartii TaxID=2732419 RepID=A0ABR4MXU3_9FUNG